MILYHGSNTKISEIELEKCRPNKDFGRGFYLTTIKEQAVGMSKRTARLYGGTPQVTAFEFNESMLDDKDIEVLKFDKPSKDWAMFVLNNRNKRFKDIQNALCNQDNKYDVVVGAVANDDIAQLFRIFSSGLIDFETLIKGLEYKKLTDQYSFHTEKAIKYLKVCEE